MLVLARKPGGSLVIGDGIEIKIIDVTGEKVRIGILAPGDVKVLRKELVQTIEENQQAVRSDIGPGAVRSLLGGRGTV